MRFEVFGGMEPTVTIRLLNFAYLCCLLITFANSLDQVQSQHLVGPDLDPNCLTQMVFLEEFFELDDFGGKKTPQKQCKKTHTKNKTKKHIFIINQSANSYIEA